MDFGETTMPGRVKRLANGLILAGVSAVTVGGWLIAPWLGLLIVGLLLMAFGVAVAKVDEEDLQ